MSMRPVLWELLQSLALKIPAHFGHGAINADKKRAWPSLLLDSVPVPSAHRGLQIATLTVSLFPNK